MSAKLNEVIYAAVSLADHQKAKTATQEHLDRLFAAVDAAHLNPGEPVFVVRGTDRLATRTIRFWQTLAEDEGSPEYCLNEVRQKHRAFEDWQNDPANALKVKVPD